LQKSVSGKASLYLNDSKKLAVATPWFHLLGEFPQTFQRTYVENCIRFLVVEPYFETRGREFIEIGEKSLD